MVIHGLLPLYQVIDWNILFYILILLSIVAYPVIIVFLILKECEKDEKRH